MAVKSVGNFADEFSNHVEHIEIVIEPDGDPEWILSIVALPAGLRRNSEQVLPAMNDSQRACRMGTQRAGRAAGA
jgi:hypothetical protein